MTNPLETVLVLASTAKGTSEAVSHLREVSKLLESSDVQVSSGVLALLEKISNRYDYQLTRFLVRIYDKVIRIVPREDPGLIITLANHVYMLCENMKGTDMARQLEGSLGELLSWVLEQGTLEREQAQCIETLLQNQESVDFNVLLKPALDDLKANSPWGINQLMESFSSLSTLQEQYYYFAFHMDVTLAFLKQSTDKEIYKRTLNFLEQLVFQVNFNINISSYDRAGTLYSHLYVVDESKYIKQYPEVFLNALQVLEFLLTSSEFVANRVLLMLARLWTLFPGLVHESYDILLSCLREISLVASIETQTQAAEFLYKVMHAPYVQSEFKGRLEGEPAIDRLFSHQSYKETPHEFEASQPIDLETLKPLAGFPLSRQIPPGETHYQIIEVNEPNCILCWGLATQYYDITYSITRVDLPEPQVIVTEERANSSEKPIIGVRLLHSAGLYKFEWSNFYSWFRHKNLRFRVVILRPFKSALPKQLAQKQYKAIEVLDSDVEHSPSTPRKSRVAEIGLWISKTSAFCLANDTVHEFALQEEGTISPEIVEFLERIQAPRKHIGIVGQQPCEQEFVRSLGKVAVARDVDALAFYCQMNLHVHTLMVVLCENGVRSSVLHRGRILLSELGKPLGDIANLPDASLDILVAKLLNLVGPGVVVITGADFTDELEDFAETVKPHVPERIWANSEIQGLSSVERLRAAAKLHDLYDKFKFAF